MTTYGSRIEVIPTVQRNGGDSGGIEQSIGFSHGHLRKKHSHSKHDIIRSGSP